MDQPITQERLIDLIIQRQPSDLGHESNHNILDSDDTQSEEPKVITKLLKTSDTVTFSPTMTTNNKAPIRVFNPYVKRNGNPELMTYVIRGEPTIGATVENPPDCSTVVPVPGYINYLTDPAYIKAHHQVINGKIVRWRSETMTLISRLIHEGQFKEEEVLDQFIFARTDSYEIMEALSNHHVLPAGCLNPTALKRYFHGINTRERADFLHQMSNCDTYEIIIHVKQVKDSEYREVQVITRFNGWCLRAYGFNAKDTRKKIFDDRVTKRKYVPTIHDV